jgi:hypothetical protein
MARAATTPFANIDHFRVVEGGRVGGATEKDIHLRRHGADRLA